MKISKKIDKQKLLSLSKGHELCHHRRMSDDEIKTILKNNSLSFTTPRLLILRLLGEEHGPFTADEIFKKLPNGSLDKASVYRSLTQFVEKELVSEIYLEKDVVHYELNDPSHHHHHIICRICHRVEIRP